MRQAPRPRLPKNADWCSRQPNNCAQLVHRPEDVKAATSPHMQVQAPRTGGIRNGAIT